MLELNKDKFSISRIPDDETGAEFSDWFSDDDCCSNCCVDDIRRPHSQPYSDDDWMRYNRAEGLYLQLNFHVENDFIPGNTFYGGIGRSFHRNKYSGIIGFEQRLLNDSIQLFIEKYDRSSTDDTWRINRRLNSLSAFFIHEDFLDWYHSDGFEAGGFIVLPWNVKVLASYKDELQSSMNTVATWSLFGSNKLFRDGYLIDEGKEVTLKYGISAGKKYKWGSPSTLSGYFQYSITESQEKSDFIFEKHDFSADTYIPLAQELGIHASVHAGTISGESIGLQHYYQIGGIGSLRGYDWKLFNGTQFSLGTLELVFGNLAVFYDRAAVWSDELNKISSDHWDKLINSYNGESVGISVGSHKTRIDIIKPLDENTNNDIQINFILFLNDGGC